MYPRFHASLDLYRHHLFCLSHFNASEVQIHKCILTCHVCSIFRRLQVLRCTWLGLQKVFFRVGDVKSKTISLGHLKFDLVSKIDAKGIESLPQTQIF